MNAIPVTSASLAQSLLAFSFCIYCAKTHRQKLSRRGFFERPFFAYSYGAGFLSLHS